MQCVALVATRLGLGDSSAPSARVAATGARLFAEQVFDFGEVRALMADHDSNRIDGTDQLLSLMNLEIWSRIYLDRRTPQDVSSELKEALV